MDKEMYRYLKERAPARLAYLLQAEERRAAKLKNQEFFGEGRKPADDDKVKGGKTDFGPVAPGVKEG